MQKLVILTTSDLNRIEELARAAKRSEVPLYYPNEPSAGEVFDFLGVKDVPAFKDDLPGIVLALVAMARRAREPRCLVTGRVETTILVPEQELGLVISVNGKRYIREDEVQRSFRAAAREVGP